MNRFRTLLEHLTVLVGRDLRQLARDPVTLVITLIAPVIGAVVASLTLGAPTKIDATFVVVGSTAGAGDVSGLAVLASGSAPGSASALHYRTAGNEDEARRLVLDGKAAAALILPTASDSTLRVIVNRNEPIPTKLAESAARTLAARSSADRAVRSAGGETSLAGAPSVVVASVSPGGRVLDGSELYGPAIATFFLFLAAGNVARSLHAEREGGTLERMRVMPLSTTTIIVAKVLTVLVLGAVEFATVLTMMSLFFGARWGNPFALLAIIGSLALAVAALTVMLAGLARTPVVAHYFEMLVALGLGALGGNLVPLQNLPDAARRIADVTPNGVAIRAMRGIAAERLGAGGLTVAVLTILAFGAVAGLIGYANGRRVVET
jgi:ABC-2 type transport system permease protein